MSRLSLLCRLQLTVLFEVQRRGKKRNGVGWVWCDVVCDPLKTGQGTVSAALGPQAPKSPQTQMAFFTWGPGNTAYLAWTVTKLKGLGTTCSPIL